jgi:hypothetical protein
MNDLIKDRVRMEYLNLYLQQKHESESKLKQRNLKLKDILKIIK